MVGKVDQSGIDSLISHCSGPLPAFRSVDLQRVLGWAVFSQEFLAVAAPLQIELRVEDWKAYILVPPHATLLGECQGKTLAYVHGPLWAKPRFQDEGGADFGLCGQWLGKSKFVAPYADRSLIPKSKEEALLAFGLKGYDMFDKPGGHLYMVEIFVDPAMLEKACLGVPLVYKVGAADDLHAERPSRWQPAQHFQEGTIPGFTGLRAELVMRTFVLHAKTVADLKSAGVTCRLLEGPH
eukprot:TRINITY_DN47459_c0_g1_i1.p1 TRINITY_DN47459_c0_g1~~TRINITY_DN47459_c0_g1_i1.p1  ORF type:complete len:274 (-),score=36.85 TRINITY_DN47459_c0_g1_i1:96-809(-)